MCWRRHNKASLARPCQLLAGFGLVRMMMMVLGAMTAMYNFTDGLRFHFRSVILLLCSSFAKNISFFWPFCPLSHLCPFRISLWTYLIFAMFFFQILHILLYSVDDPMSIRLISECINTAQQVSMLLFLPTFAFPKMQTRRLPINADLTHPYEFKSTFLIENFSFATA